MPLMDGVDLLGYTTWGCIDLVSAGTGEMKTLWLYLWDRDNEGNGHFKTKQEEIVRLVQKSNRNKW